MATDQEVYRYYELLAHIQGGKYIEKLPVVSYFNGVGQTQPQISFQSFMIWDVNGKDLTRRQVNKELPELERKYKEITDTYYSVEQVEKRKKEEEKRKQEAKEAELKEFEIMYQAQKTQNIHLFWDDQKKERYGRYSDGRRFEDRIDRKRQEYIQFLHLWTFKTPIF